MVLILSPWADAPSPPAAAVVMPDGEALAAIEPIITQEISHLTIEVALDEQAFNALVAQNDDFIVRHPDIIVEMNRIEPEQAYFSYKQSAQLKESADIMLLSNEWVKEFASMGYLLPVDAAFVGKALAEQLDALIAPLKWNGYLWGVPRDMDPYVLVWNEALLHEWLGADVVLPLTIEQWNALAAMSEQLQGIASWLMIDRNDPLALLAWLGSAAHERSDGLWDKGSEPWNGTLFEQALALLDQQRANVRFSEARGEAALRSLKEGTTIAAIVPYSEAAAWIAQQSEPQLEMDHQSWKLPFAWPRGTSFSISATTEAEEAAYVWISEMTSEQIQWQNAEVRKKLPVYRSIYDSDKELSNLLPSKTGQIFPNQPPLYMGPELTSHLLQLGILWERFAAGEMTMDQWKEEWSKLNGQS